MQSAGGRAGTCFGYFMEKLTYLMGQTDAHGAWPILYAAVSDVQPGEHYGPYCFFELKGYPKIAVIPDGAKDILAAAHLWKISEESTKQNFSI